MATNLEKTLLNPGEVASQLGIHVRTLANWRSNGLYALPYIKVGRRVMYRQAAVDAFIDQQERRHT